MSGTHEDFARPVHRRGPSDRNFGLVFTAAFLFFGLWPLFHGKAIRPAFLAAAGAILCLALIRPSLLHAPNWIWTRLGILLGKVVNPVVTALLFYLVFTPAALILRWMGKDLLALSMDPQAKSYWLPRNAASDTGNMINQF